MHILVAGNNWRDGPRMGLRTLDLMWAGRPLCPEDCHYLFYTMPGISRRKLFFGLQPGLRNTLHNQGWDYSWPISGGVKNKPGFVNQSSKPKFTPWSTTTRAVLTHALKMHKTGCLWLTLWHEAQRRKWDSIYFICKHGQEQVQENCQMRWNPLLYFPPTDTHGSFVLIYAR